MNLRNVLEEVCGIFDRHLEHVRNTLVLILHFQRLPVIPFAFANFTRNVYIGQEMHFNLDDPVPFASFAAAAFDVEAEASFLIAAHLRFGRLGEQIANVVEHPGVRCRIGTWRTTDWRLVDIDDLIHMIKPFDLLVLPRTYSRSI
ncbi:hypothetical protein D3C74_244320 [compost metagenome]